MKQGDTVAKDQSLITVESDKASMEIPSSHAGLIKELKIKLGDKVSKGTSLAIVTATADQPCASGATCLRHRGSLHKRLRAHPQHPLSSREEPTSVEAPTRSHAFATEMGARPEPLDLGPTAGAKPHASPSVRKFARELGVDLTAVRGSGPKGRITEDDVRSHVKATMAGGARPAAACRRVFRRSAVTPAAVAAGRLRQIRSDQARRDVSHPQNCRAGADAQLGDDSACHQSR